MQKNWGWGGDSTGNTCHTDTRDNLGSQIPHESAGHGGDKIISHEEIDKKINSQEKVQYGDSHLLW